MYVDDTLLQARLSDASIRLWGKRSQQYVEAVQEGTA
jgi:hypothetical protein